MAIQPGGQQIPQNIQAEFTTLEKKIAELKKQSPQGVSITVTTAPLTGGGTTGTLVFKNGILVGATQAT